jgi:predicted metal-dependent hydrolase
MMQPDLQLDLPLGGTTPDKPGGQYSLQLDEQPLPFRLRRSRRASVTLAVDEQGLQVSAPRGMALPQIEQAIREGSRAIVGKTAGAGKLPLPARWQDGARFPFLGREVVLCLDGGRDRIDLCEGRLHLPLPPEAGEKQVKDGVQGWLQAQAQLAIGAQLEAGCRRLNMPKPPWRLSFAAGAWGGVDPDGRLRFSWRLIHISPEEIGNVVCRLLARLGAMRQAPELWADDAASLPA